MNALPAFMFVYHIHAWFLKGIYKGIRSSKIKDADSCKPTKRFWKSILGHLPIMALKHGS